MNLVFSTTQQPSSCKQDGVFSSAQFSWQVVKQYRGFRMERDLNPACPQPRQGIFKVLRFIPAACVQWCRYFHSTQRTLTRPKALSTGDIYAILPNIWIYIKHTQTQNAQLLISAPLNTHRMLPCVFTCNIQMKHGDDFAQGLIRLLCIWIYREERLCTGFINQDFFSPAPNLYLSYELTFKPFFDLSIGGVK